MAILTLKQARDNLYKAVVPNLSTQQNIDTFNQYLNWAQERLINSGLWSGMTVETLIAADELNGYFTLPPRFISALAMKYQVANQGTGRCYLPVQIQSRWFSYQQGGPWLWNNALWGSYGWWDVTAYSRDYGDGYVTFKESPYESYYLRFTLENASDDGAEVVIKGYGTDGEKIFTPSSSSAYEGMTETLSYAVTTTTQVFTKEIYGLQLPARQGYLALDAVDVDTGAVTRIGYYMPSEIMPCYRRYGTECLGDSVDYVSVLGKIRYLPALADTDEIWPANYGALRNMLAGLVYEAQNDFGRYQECFAEAIKLLNNEAKESRGGAMISLNVNPTAYQAQNIWGGY